MNARMKRKSILPIVLIGAIAFAAVAAVAFYVITGAKPPILPPPKPHHTIKPPVITQVPLPQVVTVYLPEVVGEDAYLKPVKVRSENGARGSIVNIALATLLAEGQKAGNEVIPSGTRLLSPVKVTGDAAIVNLSKEFVDNFPGGSTQEDLTLNSIAYTAVSNSGGAVKRVQILVEGETVETLGGHYSLDEPLEPDPDVLKPGGAS